MKLAKAAGLIEKFPNGGNFRSGRIRSRDPSTARLEREAVAAIEAMLAGLPAVPDKPLEEMSVDEKRAAVTGASLISRCVAAPDRRRRDTRSETRDCARDCAGDAAVAEEQEVAESKEFLRVHAPGRRCGKGWKPVNRL